MARRSMFMLVVMAATAMTTTEAFFNVQTQDCYTCLESDDIDDNDGCLQETTCTVSQPYCKTIVKLTSDGQVNRIIKGCASNDDCLQMNADMCSSDGRQCEYCCDSGDLCNHDLSLSANDLQTYEASTPDPSLFQCYSCENEPDNTECNFYQVEVCSEYKQACGATVYRNPDGTFKVYKECMKPELCTEPGVERYTTNGKACRICCNDSSLCNVDACFPDGVRKPLPPDQAERARGDGEYGECRCWGDPHCRSFDYRHTRYQGTCTYLMARDACQDGFPQTGQTPSFEIFADFYREQDDDLVSWVRDVIIRFEGSLIKLKYGKRLEVDGTEITTLPYHIAGESGSTIVSFTENVQYLIMVTYTNLLVKIDSTGGMTIALPRDVAFTGNVCGICGNFDDNSTNDWVIGPYTPCDADGTTQGQQTDNELEFGNSWNAANMLPTTDSDAGCDPEECPGTPPSEGPCPDDARLNGAEELCNPIIDDQIVGFFRNCILELDQQDVQELYDACVYDICSVGVNVTLKCLHLEHMSELCMEELGIDTGDWRTEYNCPICPENSSPASCGDACQPTCTNPNPSQEDEDCTPFEIESCQVMCVCDEGYVFDGENCILATLCPETTTTTTTTTTTPPTTTPPTTTPSTTTPATTTPQTTTPSTTTPQTTTPQTTTPQTTTPQTTTPQTTTPQTTTSPTTTPPTTTPQTTTPQTTTPQTTTPSTTTPPTTTPQTTTPSTTTPPTTTPPTTTPPTTMPPTTTPPTTMPPTTTLQTTPPPDITSSSTTPQTTTPSTTTPSTTTPQTTTPPTTMPPTTTPLDITSSSTTPQTTTPQSTTPQTTLPLDITSSSTTPQTTPPSTTTPSTTTPQTTTPQTTTPQTTTPQTTTPPTTPPPTTTESTTLSTTCPTLPAWSTTPKPFQLPCVCYVEGDPLVQSYDKTLKLIIDEQKTLLSRGMNPDKHDRCKFQARVQTDDDYPGKEGQVYVTWVAFSFGVHKKPRKFLRAIQIFQDQVLIRGHGVRGKTPVQLPYTYTTHHNPSGDPVTVHVYEDGNTVILESEDCPWRLEYVRLGFDSKIRLAVGARYRPENNEGRNMDGICGNCDGHFDYVLCGEDRKDVSDEEDKYKQISESCAEGKHQHKD